VTSNTASIFGGGLYLYYSPATLTNTVVADNRVGASGSGLYVYASAPRLLHITIARNRGGEGSGIYVSGNSTAWLTNTILVSHTMGITVSAGNTANMSSTLWYGSAADWGGAGTINHSGDYTGAPAFVDPDRGDYHIGPGSAAIDRGVDAGVTTDKDGLPRDAYPDLGAYEAQAKLVVTKEVDRNPVQAGSRLTYTIRVTNTGNIDLHATVTDTLPAQVTPGGDLTWTPVITTPGGVWTATVVVTANWSCSGTLTNVVEVTTAEGAAGIYTATTTAQVTPALEVSKQAAPDPVQVGERLTYTIRVTNTGNVDLNARVTDTLPLGVTPAGEFTWTPVITAPGGVWTATVVVTVNMGYVEPLTNVVRVTTAEGAAGVYTKTTQARKRDTTTTLTSWPNPSVFGQSVTFTATVTSAGGAPTSVVTFTLDTTMSVTHTLNASSVATYATSSLTVGGHILTAQYGGDASFNGSVSSPLNQVVNKADSSTTLASWPNPSVFGQPVTFTATVTSAGGTPTGMVVFQDGGSGIVGCTAQPLSGGLATCTTASLAVGTHSVTAQYSGAASFNGGTSSPLNQAVKAVIYLPLVLRQ